MALTAKRGHDRAQLLVVNKADQRLDVIDLARGITSASIALSGRTGHEVAVSTGGRTAFVPIYSDASVGHSGSDGHTIDLIDLDSATLSRTHDLGAPARPHCAVVGGDGLLYVTAETRREILLLDAVTCALVAVIPTGAAQSHMLALSADRSLACTGNVTPGSVSVLDVAARELRGVVPVSESVNRITVSADGRLAFTADQTTPRLAVIDTRDLAVTGWISLPGMAFGTALTSSGTLVVALRKDAAIAIVDLTDPRSAWIVPVPAGPQSIVLDDTGRWAYSACRDDGVIVEVDLASAKVSRVIPAGQDPDGLCWMRRVER